MSGAEIVKALGGRWHGRQGHAVCPAHKDNNPSLAIREQGGRTLLHCHAGCSQADVLDALKARGLWPNGSEPPAGGNFHGRTSRRRDVSNSSAASTCDERKRTAAALEIWRSAQPAGGSHVETYLRSRGITLPVTPSLRYAHALTYTPSGITLPAMVAAVQRPDGRVQAVHRTYLRMDGTGKANVAQPRLCLGPMTGCAVRLAPAATTLCLCEGIEDALALMQMTGRATWAVLGTSGFKNVMLPPQVKTIVLAPDADAAGDGVVADAAERFTGRRVLHLRPPEGRDWCDVLEDFEERAAIREHDAGGARPDAELRAFADLVGGTVCGG